MRGHARNTKTQHQHLPSHSDTKKRPHPLPGLQEIKSFLPHFKEWVTESRDAGELSSQEERPDLNLRSQRKVLPLRLWLLPYALHKGGAQSIFLRTANEISLDDAMTEQEEEAEQTRHGAEEGF